MYGMYMRNNEHLNLQPACSPHQPRGGTCCGCTLYHRFWPHNKHTAHRQKKFDGGVVGWPLIAMAMVMATVSRPWL